MIHFNDDLKASFREMSVLDSPHLFQPTSSHLPQCNIPYQNGTCMTQNEIRRIVSFSSKPLQTFASCSSMAEPAQYSKGHDMVRDNE